MNVPHLRLVPSVDAVHDLPPRRFSDIAPFPIAALAAGASVATLSWFDLAAGVAVGVAGVFAWRGSDRARIVVASLLLYLSYAFALRATATPFGPLFLVHSASLGASAFALVDLGIALHDDRAWAWFGSRAPHRIVAVALIACAAVLGVAWGAGLAPSLAAPVSALDIALVLPALAVAGVNVLRRSSPGANLQAAVLLGFACALTAGIAVSLVGGELVGLIAMAALAFATLKMYFALVAGIRVASC